ncbi:MAG: ABC transporter ATP-binding protein, partial [Deltaproteobacteria bacterium]|nr:ABC transporter ATP-binding protein [Deltaproteobacteria bacterium]
MDSLGKEYVRQNIQLNLISGGFYPLMAMFTNLSLAIILYFGGRMTIWASISPGDFVAFLSYLGLLTWPMMALGWMTDLLQRGAAGMDRINSVLDQAPDITDPLDPVPLPVVHGGITIKNLSFSYLGRDLKAVDEVNLDCPAGKITAIVGRTGAGKSTLLNLVPRLFDPPPGTIFIDGVDVRTVKLADLRSAIGYVPQDGYIFSGTIAENIAFGRPDADETSIRAAARAAQIEEEIETMPQGYQTTIGERGLTLSGGQRQRLSLARALLLEPPILILDDTFSALDADAEERILAQIAQTRAGLTPLIVSHRLTSLKIADLIPIIDQGRVTESGTHEELLTGD